MATSEHNRTKSPWTDEEVQLIADVAGIPAAKVRTIMELAAKAIHEKGGFILTGGKMQRASGANAAWNMPTIETLDAVASTDPNRGKVSLPQHKKASSRE